MGRIGDKPAGRTPGRLAGKATTSKKNRTLFLDSTNVFISLLCPSLRLMASFRASRSRTWLIMKVAVCPTTTTAKICAEAFEAVADLKQRKLVSWKKLNGVQPNWLRDELDVESQVR